MLEVALRGPGRVARSSGNARRALAAAPRRIEAEYRWPWQAHAATEPLSAVAHVKEGGCEIWAGMQNPNGAQAGVAEALAIPLDRVVVNPMRLGGGFGRRIASDYVVEAAHVSRAIGGPVQVVWTREDDFQHDMYGAAQINRLAAALDGAGRITAWEHRVGDFHLSMFGSYDPSPDPAAGGDPWGGFDSPYIAPNLRVDTTFVESPVQAAPGAR
jgi:isoquinoline 1-oxidoreductase beta subunit